MNKGKTNVRTLVTTAILTALVVLLQFLGSAIKLGPFSISLVLIPIVIGAAKCGIGAGAWLGFVFGAVVLLSGDAALFMAASVPGTIITVLAKGIICGLGAGAMYKLSHKIFENDFVSAIISAIVCPVLNTGVFLLGCLVFFMDTVKMWAEAAGLGANVGQYMIFGLVGANFLFEIAVNVIFSPAIVQILKATEK